MRAVGAIWWGFNRPGCFVAATIEENGRLHVVADLKFQYRSEEFVAEEIAAVMQRRGLVLVTCYAPAEMFDLTTPETRKAIPVEPPADVFRRSGLALIPVASDEAHGFQRLHDYFRDAPDGRPWLIIDPSCKTVLRTLPTLTQKKTDPDQVADGPSHAAHALRILVSARPSPKALEQRKPPPKEFTVAWLKALDDAPREGALLRRHG